MILKKKLFCPQGVGGNAPKVFPFQGPPYEVRILFSLKVWFVASILKSFLQICKKNLEYLFSSSRNLHLKEEICQFSIYLHFRTSNDNLSDQYRDILNLFSVMKSSFKELSDMVPYFGRKKIGLIRGPLKPSYTFPLVPSENIFKNLILLKFDFIFASQLLILKNLYC